MKNTINDYKVVVGWSEQDRCFLARVPAFPGLTTDGETPEVAVAEARIALGGMLAALDDAGEDSPEPDMTLEQVRKMLPLIKVSKLASMSKINRQTLVSKLKRGTRFSPAEARRIHKAIDTVLS